MIARVVTVAMMVALLGVADVSAQADGVRIDGISPFRAIPGDRVTVTGAGFGGGSLVGLIVGGQPVPIALVRGSTLVFVVPSGLTPGIQPVVISNPGQRTAVATIEIIDTGLLYGPSDRRALDALSDRPSVGVPTAEIENGVIMTRLDVVVDPDASIGQVNTALTAISGRIVSMRAGSPFLTISIPRAANRTALESTRATLAAAPGILTAMGAAELAAAMVPFGDGAVQASHLLATRFPAAWNVRHLIVKPDGACRGALIPVLVADHFPNPELYADIRGEELPTFRMAEPSPPGSTDIHGYDVAAALGGQFDGTTPLGANPFVDCLDLIGIPFDGRSTFQSVDALATNFPAGPFIVNVSMTYTDECLSADGQPRACTPADFINNPEIPPAFDRALHTLNWKQRTAAQWDRFLLFGSGGNQGDTQGAVLYPALEEGLFKTPFTMATASDPLLRVAGAGSLWTSQFDGWPSLAATDVDLQVLVELATSQGLDQVAGAPNTGIVGATTKTADPYQVRLAPFSNLGGTLHAVGTGVPGLLEPVEGASFSTPQAAALASYLWLLSDATTAAGSTAGPALKQRPAKDTLDLIARTTIAVPTVPNLIDAYAAVLELDRGSTTLPIRRALLDVHEDTVFDHLDLLAYEQALQVGVAGAEEFPAPDYSRYDLNGDGATGGRGIGRFDLDANGTIGQVDVQVEGRTVTMNEAALTDLQILCYYAYSPMYRLADDTMAARTDILGLPACALIVEPAAVTLKSGDAQQFTATVGSGAVTWTASACSITDTGLYTACGSSDTVTVRATSVDNPVLYAEAIVTLDDDGDPPPPDSYTGTIVQWASTRSETRTDDGEGGVAIYTSGGTEEVTWTIYAVGSLYRAPLGTVKYDYTGDSLQTRPDGTSCSNKTTTTGEFPITGYSDSSTTSTTGGFFYTSGTVTHTRVWNCYGNSGSETSTQSYSLHTGGYHGLPLTRPTYVFDASGAVVAFTWDFHYTDPRVLYYESSVTGRVNYTP